MPKNIESSIRAKGRFTEALFNLALRTAYAYNSDGYGRGSGWRIVLAPVVGIFDALLFRKVRQAFGCHLEFFVGGGALLDAELQRFFYAIGIPMFQGYGLSEATPVISTNSPKHHWHRFGSSGKILIPLDLKILDEEGREVPRGQKGEIVVRGENVMAGYWKNPGATAETVRDGWLHTGDMGYVSEDDFLYVLGRFKSLLIASDGEKYSPEGMEEAIVDKSPYIDQIIVHNNQSPFTGAIVVPNREALRRELEAIAAAKGIDLSKAAAGSTHGSTVPPTARYSTLQDLDAGRHTEIDMFSGALMRMGRKLGIPTPYNEYTYHMIKALEEKNDGLFDYTPTDAVTCSR